jgi:quinoprotein glucose dehydrogenase
MSVDESLDLVYLPTTSPSVDFWGGTRPGNNQYADSIVALKGSTGEVAWSFQFTHPQHLGLRHTRATAAG